ncbi:MAG: hypothetical protein ACO27Q_02060, partial [Bacteroidia bacterium]
VGFSSLRSNNRAKRARSSPDLQGIALKIFKYKTRPEGTRPNKANQYLKGIAQIKIKQTR